MAKRNEMEERLNCEDRGKVDPSCDGRYLWVVCCYRCNHTAHIVIREFGVRGYACPRCLVYLDGDPHPQQRHLSELRNRKPGTSNRIKGYLEDEKDRYNPNKEGS